MLHPRVRLVWGGGAVITALLVGGLGAVGVRLGIPIPPTVVAGFAALIGTIGVVLAVLRYRVWRYEIGDDALFLIRGVFTRRDTAVPFVRVQHIDTQRGPLERVVGLASVVVYTAGTRGADITIPGLTPDRAATLRERLRELATESEYDAV